MSWPQLLVTEVLRKGLGCETWCLTAREEHNKMMMMRKLD